MRRTLIGMLKEHDEFWKSQHLEKDWWNTDTNSELKKFRRDRSGEDYHAVYALGQIGDGRARGAVQAVRERWLEVGMESKGQNVEACDKALRQFDKAARQQGAR